MVIYNFFSTIVSMLQIFTKVEAYEETYVPVLLSSVGGAFLLWLGLFILQGIGLYVMAKKRNMNRKWMAFVPFANILYMGKLAGECSFFGQKMKRAGLYAMIAQILATAVCFLAIASEIYLYFKCGLPQVNPTEIWDGLKIYDLYWEGLTGFDNVVYQYYNTFSYYIISVFDLIAEVFMLVLLMGLCKKYIPSNYVLLSILSVFFVPARYIVVFILRKRKAVDYAAYMRAKQEEFQRRQQQYYNQYGNPYNRPPYQNGGYNPYGNPYGQQNPYAQQQRQNPQPKPDDDPFAEFASENKNGRNSSSGNGENTTSADKNSDDFFS